MDIFLNKRHTQPTIWTTGREVQLERTIRILGRRLGSEVDLTLGPAPCLFDVLASSH